MQAIYSTGSQGSQPMMMSGQQPMIMSGQQPMMMSGQQPMMMSGQQPMYVISNQPGMMAPPPAYGSGMEGQPQVQYVITNQPSAPMMNQPVIYVQGAPPPS